MRSISLTTQVDPEQLSEELAKEGSLLIQGLSDDTDLLACAESMGEITEPGVGMQQGMHDGRIYSVAIRGDGGGELDKYGHPILSTTDREFPLHTDAYNRLDPPRYVFLMRADQGASDTLSQVADSRKALERISAEDRAVLQEPRYPSAEGYRPLLEETGGSWRIRFNGEEIRRWSERLQGLSSAAARAVAAVEEALTTEREEFFLESKDCLLLDNWRVCHGRSRIPAGSERVLKRVWVEG